MEHDRPLPAVHRAELGEAHREVAVGVAVAAVDENVERAVHRLDPVLDALVDLHPGEHVLGVIVEMPRVCPARSGHVRRYDELKPKPLMEPAAVILHQLADHPAVGKVDRQPLTQLAREGVEPQLGPSLRWSLNSASSSRCRWSSSACFDSQAVP